MPCVFLGSTRKPSGVESGFSPRARKIASMDVKHCTCIFKQKADVFQRLVHLQKPQDYMDIVEKGATMTSESEESFQGAGWG